MAEGAYKTWGGKTARHRTMSGTVHYAIATGGANGLREPQRRVCRTTILNKPTCKAKKAAIQRAPKALSAPRGVSRLFVTIRPLSRESVLLARQAVMPC